MSRVNLKVEGGDQLIAALRKLGKEGEAAIAKAVTQTAIDVRSDIIKRYQRGPKTGRTYTRGNVEHTASAPGEAPATDTGRLVSGTDYKSTGKLSAEVGNKVKYGPMLEFGTFKIAPRPAWLPAIEAAAPKYIKRLETALARIMK
jgi:HK97 gp10 family phage protein